MMSSGLNRANANDSTMPGDYASWPGPAARDGLLGGAAPLSPEPMIPPARTPFPRLPPNGPTGGLPGRTPFPRLPAGAPPIGQRRRRRPPGVPRIRIQGSPRHRRRPVIPDIVIERRHHCHSSGGRHRVISIPLDHRPTLGLRGPPTRVIEIERIPCRRRRRRSRSVCYEYEYDDPPHRLPPPPPPQPQPTIMMANPAANSSLQTLQPSFAIPINNTATTTTAVAAPTDFLSNLTADTINNLPRQQVHLPPILLPGTQVDANTEVETIILPAEIIHPFNGSLSVIQANPGVNTSGITNFQTMPAAPVQPQFINIPTTTGIQVAPRGLPPPPPPSVTPAMAGDPLMNRFRDLFQRLNVQQTQQTQPTLPAGNPPIIRPTLPSMTQFVPRSNTMNNLPTMSQFAPRNNILNSRPTMSQFDPSSSTLNNRSMFPSMNAANIRNYPSTNTQFTNPLNTGSYRPANISPMIPSNIPPSGSVNNMSYRPTGITPYQTTSFTPSPMANNTTYRPSSIPASDQSDVGPYRPANITPYTNTISRSNNNPLQPSSFTSRPTGYSSSPAMESQTTFTPFPRLSSFPPGPTANSINPSSSSVSLTTPTNPSLSSTPKSILRNTPSVNFPDTNTYSQLNSPNVMSSNDTIRKTTRFA